MRNSKVIIAKNIKLDKRYTSVLNITEQNMINLMLDNANLVYTSNTYSFLREEKNSINVKVPYGTALQGNYLAFQNPDYSNKWFFAFIDSVNYISNETTRINYTIDIFTTWWEYWSSKACFVVREHVTDDTIGLHTIPENLETGEYILNESIINDTTLGDTCYIVGATTFPNMSKAEDSLCGAGEYNGVYSAVKYFRYDTVSALDIVLELWNKAGKIDSVTCVFMAPKILCPVTPTTDNEGNPQNTVSESTAAYYYGKVISKQTTLDGYSPVNNKLKCYPYNYLYATNNSGGNAIYRYELFKGSNVEFGISCALVPGCSIRSNTIGYKATNNSMVNYSEGMTAGKYPICNFANDVYTNWLTQQSVNMPYDTLKSTVTGATGGAVVGGIPGAIFGATMGFIGTIWQQMREKENHQFIPPQVEGNLNAGDVNASLGITCFSYYKMSIREEFARIIDAYFTRFGYLVNTFKIPNMQHRQNYNYVEISNSDTLCYSNNHNNIMVPAQDLESINNIFRNGVTIWNNHTNLGDYSVSNNITS